MIRDYRDIKLTVQRPTPIDKEVNWNKSLVVISETDVYGRITNVNDVFCNVCGYSAAEMIGQPGVIDNYVAPFYDTLLKLEKIGGMELSTRFFKNYLAKQGKDYIDFIIDIMNENRENVSFEENQVSSVDTTQVISDDIVTMNEAQNEKRKSFFGRLFVQ